MVDFEYQIHSDVGDHCVGVKVNGRIFPLDGELRSGDVVEIITQKSKLPSESWLQSVKTGNAKNHIRAALKKKPSSLKRSESTKTELRLTIVGHPGIMNTITEMISRSHAQILAVSTPGVDPKTKTQTIKIQLPVMPKDKAEKLLVKLKTLREVRGAGYRMI